VLDAAWGSLRQIGNIMEVGLLCYLVSLTEGIQKVLRKNESDYREFLDS